MKKVLVIFICMVLASMLIACESKVDTHNREALKYVRMGNYTEALNLLNKAVELDPEDDTSWNNISLCYDAIGEYQLALEAAQKAVNLGEESEIEYSNLGNAYFDLGNIEEAKMAYEKALEIDDEYFYALYGMGIYYSEKEEYEKALEYFYNLYNNNPINVDVVRYIAFCNYKLGLVDESIEFLQAELDKVSSTELEQLLELLLEYRHTHSDE
ncbi:tetratricopeptide repeat protein [Acidaminobacter sp. JC074]|uniref:tetratricopeptide repeat protein n=1 Tax=Acidaminobacter sp. JC074 TaxID=2530199 RepID=UPI001F10F070|nr:tetratricopeptide repeat protein [Acidaminobacter sp. JC074]